VETRDKSYLRRPIPLSWTVVLSLMLNAPLLMMQLPINTSYDANFHIFFASHYAQHWFDPWNTKWFAGFSQTTYPPLGHQWIAVFSYIVGLNMAYMLVQLIGVLLFPIGVYRFAKLWVSTRAASYAAFLSVFLGSLWFLVYSSGQLSTTLAAPFYLLALPYCYEWLRWGRARAFFKGVLFMVVAAGIHHVTLIFGAPLLALPVLWLAWSDRRTEGSGATPAVVSRAVLFAVICGAAVGIVLLPYFLTILQHPITQVPIPHGSRNNLLLTEFDNVINYFLVPYGFLLPALPFILIKGATRRLMPLTTFFWLTFIFSLGSTTPLPRWVMGRAFEILTFERFSLWASMLALPVVGLLVEEWLERSPRFAAAAVSVAAVATVSFALGWMNISPFKTVGAMNVNSVLQFLNRDGHDKYRYFTLGFGNALPKVSTYSDASSVDGEYNSARLLPEMTQYGSGQLSSAKFYGRQGMEALRAMLKHANKYGVKWVFVHDPYYEPLLAFAGWRRIEVFESGMITVWTKDDVPPARPVVSDAVPPAWEGLLWGTLPFGCSLLALFVAFMFPDRVRALEVVPPSTMPTPVSIYAREAR
jgi:hypothetical protein